MFLFQAQELFLKFLTVFGLGTPHINRLKKKNYKVILVDIETGFDKSNVYS